MVNMYCKSLNCYFPIMMRMVSVPIFCAKEERSVLRNVLYLFIFPRFGSTDKEYFPNPHHIIVGLSLSCFEY